MNQQPNVGRFAPPPLNNTPPQIFGAYNANSSPVQQFFPESVFQSGTASSGVDDAHDANDQKRRRIARACDMCRKKKIKCDGKVPACTHCQNYNTECMFTHVEKKRSPPKGVKYIEGLENRLGRMESLLRLSGLLAGDDAPGIDLSAVEKRLASSTAEVVSPSRSSDRSGSIARPADSERDQESSISSPQSVIDPSQPARAPTKGQSKEKGTSPQEDVAELSDMMCSLMTNDCGETRYLGSSSGFSIFSPKGIQWVNEKTGDNSFESMFTAYYRKDNKWLHWKPEIFGDIFERRIYTPLPSKEETLSLLDDFFIHFNRMFPLFHEPTFMHLVDMQYSSQPYQGSGWWASLNVALAIGHRLRAMSNVGPTKSENQAWAYLKNALGVLTELTMRNTDLLSVQALLGMTLFFQGTPNPQPSFVLLAAAVRLAHSIGLHKRGSGFNLNAIEVEQRKRVFWIAYLLDKSMCLRSGRPPVQDDDDMNVELPCADPGDDVGNIPLADGKGKVNLFRLFCTFAMIESKVYKQLYSVKAAKQSDGELLNIISELDRELEEWKDSVPIEFRPEHPINARHTPFVVHVVVLHFAYYNCLTTIHRMSVHHGYWTSRLSNYAIQGLNARPLGPRVFSSATLCVQAARTSIHLLKYIPKDDIACVWLILYYPVSALVTLFANILQNPHDQRARADLKLMNTVLGFLSWLSSEEENASVKHMLHVCSEFERIANVVLDKADKEGPLKRKRRQQGDEIRPQSHTPQRRHYQPIPVQQTYQAQTKSAAPEEAAVPPHSLSSAFNTDLAGQPIDSGFPGFNPTLTGDLSWTPELAAGDLSTISMPQFAGEAPIFSMEEQGYGNGMTSTSTSFQQPFIPPDLWSMPMTLEWDWADMSNYGGALDGSALTSIERIGQGGQNFEPTQR